MHRLILAISLFTLIAGCAMPAFDDPRTAYTTSEDQSADTTGSNMRVVFIDVGQGDATLIVAPNGEALLIDAGPADGGPPAIRAAMDKAGVTSLTAIVATHYHADHIGGIAEMVKEHIPYQGIYDRGGSYESTNPAWEAYSAAAGVMRHTVYPGDRIDCGEVSVEVVAADGELGDGTQVAPENDDENAASVVLLIEYGVFRMLIGGDLTGGGGTPPYDTPDVETPLAQLVGDIDVLQVNHHGSTTSTNQAFLNATTPEIAVISCGDANDHFHPHRSVLDRLLDAGIEIFQTERGFTPHEYDVTIADGNITLTTDGDDYFLSVPM